MKPSLAPTSSLVPESVASSTSSVTAFSHQRSLSRTRRDEASKRQNGKHSRHPSVVSASGTDQASGQPIDKSPELVEGGYGFCAKCRRASARCSIWCVALGGCVFWHSADHSPFGLVVSQSVAYISFAQSVLTEAIMNVIGTIISSGR